MIDFEKEQAKALAYASQFYTIKRRKVQGLEKYVASLLLETPEGIEELPVEIVIPATFPIKLPEIKALPENRARLRLLAHVGSTICTLDSATTIPRVEAAEYLLNAVLDKATYVLQTSISFPNQAEFDEEFLHYWSEKFGKVEPTMSLLDLCWGSSEEIRVFRCIPRLWGRYAHVAVTEGDALRQFKELASSEGLQTEETEFLYLGNIASALSPPFFETNGESLAFLEQTGHLESFKRHVNSTKPRVVIFSRIVKSRRLILGWEYDQPAIPSKGGFRDNYPKFKLLSQQGSSKPITRFFSEEYSRERMSFRTVGDSDSGVPCNEILIAGVGSLGSHLVDQVLLSEPKALTLVDPDTFKIENVGRHLLDLSYVGSDKVDAMRKHILRKRPEIEVTSVPMDVIQFLMGDISVVNKFAFAVIATGDLNSTVWIADAIEASLWKVPTLFIWVEPYLAAGHAILIDPSSVTAKGLEYIRSPIPAFNAIEVQPDQSFAIQDLGCNSTFIPYSDAHMRLFLSALHPELHRMSTGGAGGSRRWTWLGDLPYLRTNGVPINKNYDGAEFSILEEVI